MVLFWALLQSKCWYTYVYIGSIFSTIPKGAWVFVKTIRWYTYVYLGPEEVKKNGLPAKNILSMNVIKRFIMYLPTMKKKRSS
ncbi:hypothetical protein WDU94_004577 [Cyamophila willieti]